MNNIMFIYKYICSRGSFLGFSLLNDFYLIKKKW